MSSRRILAVALLLVVLPGAFALVEAVSFEVRNRSDRSLVSSGRTREYILYVPRTYDRSRPAPLVISLHGAGGWPMQQMLTSQWNRVADAHGFIVAYPSGLADGGPRVWHERAVEGDVQFIADLIDTIESEYNIDPQRIYANGLSNGGGMTFALSCRLSDRLAAVGMVGAAQTQPFEWCGDSHPIPMIAFHGTDDTMAPYKGGMSWLAPAPFPDVITWTRKWARRNHCAPDPIDSTVAADVTRREYRHCADDATVVLYTIRGGGHTWPGSPGKEMPAWFVGRTTMSIDASSTMWEFFRAHPRRDTK